MCTNTIPMFMCLNITLSGLVLLFMPPTLKKLKEHIALGLSLHSKKVRVLNFINGY